MSEYTFYVVATDGGRDIVRTSSAKVTILVDDANDHTPGTFQAISKAMIFLFCHFGDYNNRHHDTQHDYDALQGGHC